jgi:hypothetical protein
MGARAVQYACRPLPVNHKAIKAADGNHHFFASLNRLKSR